MRDEDSVLADREMTIRRFKNGEIAFKETPLGGCVTTEVCNKQPMRDVSACIGCKNAVIKPSKLRKVIEAQINLVNSLDAQSMVFRMEVEHLKSLQTIESQAL